MTRNRPPIERAVADLLQSGRLAPSFGVSDNELEATYAQGYRHYLARQYRPALKLFARAALLDPLIPKFQFGLAACYQQLGEYWKAIRHYGAAATLVPDDLRSLLHTAECLLMLDKRDKARECLQMLLADAKSQSGNATDIQTSAQALLDTLSKTAPRPGADVNVSI